ncbi:MarR family transcriptional regulator [Heliobacterium undosum]|uniref:MarR family transcriptional regulator n=1 Tax=Heliomicrobium undosum TaxID=121734 RepID=A0A845L2U0_9FIRM|nr:MarR family transcriptional regulator [Heliomicrobium undosum]MZP30006.1 MarR family transcriptional regulator [Heliomicrobium undosum]
MDFRLDESIGYLLNRTSIRLKNKLLRSFKPYNMTPEQWAVLKGLSEKEGISPKEIAELTSKDQPSTVRILEKLEKKGFITRRVNREDTRSYLLFITAAGRELVEELIPLAKEVLDTALQGIEKEKIDEFKKMLNVIYRNVDG